MSERPGFAVEDYAFIAKRLTEIRAERAQFSGVMNSPLPEVPPAESEKAGEYVDPYAYF